jgi:hypothetical protein
MQEIFSQIKYYRQKEGKFYEKTFEVAFSFDARTAYRMHVRASRRVR